MELLQKTTPVQLRWERVNYDITISPSCFARCSKDPVKSKPQVKHILQNVTGVVESGGMLAIIGASGSGKTSLLNVLSGKLMGKHTGSIKVNGEPLDRKILKRIAGFVPQEDILMGSQTVRETLQFYANLKLPTTTSDEDKEKLVDHILVELGLKKVESSLVGYVGADAVNSGLKKSLSGGERKRLSIGCQLVSNPSLLFLDEPTTGLDSFSAHSVIKTISKLSQQGRTIIFTIHQPSSEIFNLFDRMLLLGRGQTIYFGEAANLLDHFRDVGYNCPSWENPAEFVMDVVHGSEDSGEENAIAGGEFGKHYEKVTAQAIDLSNKYHASKYAKLTCKSPPPPVELTKKKHMPGFGKQLGHLVARAFRNLFREPSAVRAGLAQVLFVSLIMGLVYLRLGHFQVDLQNRTGALFFGTVFLMFGGIMGPFFLFPTERKIFLYHSMDGLYSTAAYFLAKLMSEIPIFAGNCTLFVSVFYWMVGFKATAGAFFSFLGIVFLINNVAFSYGVLVINLIPDPSVALNIFPILFMPIMLFSGFYLNFKNTPKYLVWVEHLSFLKYAFRSAFNNEFTDTEFDCNPAKNETVDAGVLGSFCPISTGNEWRRFWYMDTAPVWMDCLILLLMTITMHLAAFVLLRKAARNNAG